jgi:biopolymer transport protein ExbB
MNVLRTLYELLLLTGATWVLWLLLGLSVLSIALVVERALHFAAHRGDLGVLQQQLRAALAAGDLDGTRRVLQGSARVEARIALEGLRAAAGGADAVAEALIAATATERTQLERHLAFLGTLGNNAPFIGLFGTVVGIIKAFHDLSIDTSGGAKVVMAGISEALVATAMGLFVALPAVIAHNYFQRRIRALLAGADALGHQILSHLRAVRASPGEASRSAAGCGRAPDGTEPASHGDGS